MDLPFTASSALDQGLLLSFCSLDLTMLSETKLPSELPWAQDSKNLRSTPRVGLAGAWGLTSKASLRK